MGPPSPKNLHDVLVLQLGHVAAFASLVDRDLQGHLPVQGDLPRQIHDAEAAPAEDAHDLEVAEPRSRGQRGVVGRPTCAATLRAPGQGGAEPVCAGVSPLPRQLPRRAAGRPGPRSDRCRPSNRGDAFMPSPGTSLRIICYPAKGFAAGASLRRCQRRATVVQQPQLDQLLLRLVQRRLVQGTHHGIQEPVGKHFPGTVDQHPHGPSRERLAQLRRQALGQFGGVHFRVVEPKAKHGMIGLARGPLGIGQGLPATREELVPPASRKRLVLVRQGAG